MEGTKTSINYPVETKRDVSGPLQSCVSVKCSLVVFRAGAGYKNTSRTGGRWDANGRGATGPCDIQRVRMGGAGTTDSSNITDQAVLSYGYSALCFPSESSHY